jgi:hypothetical protein
MRKLLLLALLPMAACATIVNGTSQDVAINTSPIGAACDVTRQGSHIGSVMATPGSLHVDKSGKDLTISCMKDGFTPAQATQAPTMSAATLGNVLLGGLVGIAVDASTGANFSYHDVQLTLQPSQPIAPVAVQADLLHIIPAGYHVVRD